MYLWRVVLPIWLSVMALFFVVGVVDSAENALTTTILYDGAAGGTPDTQQFSYLTSPFFNPTATQSAASGVTTLDTTPTQSEQAGYFKFDAPVLSRTVGFRLTFVAQVEAEAHANNNRAGFSVILLSEDLQGVELGFWANEVWAQEGGTTNLFTHAEGAAFDTTSGLISYTLDMRGDSYTLTANSQTILTGSLRDYTAFSGFPDVYEEPSFIFLGDDTGSAEARVKLSYVAITEGIPEEVPVAVGLQALETAVTDRKLEIAWLLLFGVTVAVGGQVYGRRLTESCG